MGNKSMHIIYDELMDKLLNGFVFYVPKEIISEKIISVVNAEIDIEFFNVYHLIVNEEFGDCDIKEFKMKQFEKAGSLEANIFELLELKRELSSVEFQYIITKYLDIVEFISAISNWFKDNNIEFMKQEADDDSLTVFAVQSNMMATHFEELYKTFGKEYEFELKKEYSVELIVNKYIPECITRYLKFFEKVDLKSDDIQVKASTPKKDQKTTKEKPKKELVTEFEVETFLLQTVFNVALVGQK